MKTRTKVIAITGALMMSAAAVIAHTPNTRPVTPERLQAESWAITDGIFNPNTEAPNYDPDRYWSQPMTRSDYAVIAWREAGKPTTAAATTTTTTAATTTSTSTSTTTTSTTTTTMPTADSPQWIKFNDPYWGRLSIAITEKDRFGDFYKVEAWEWGHWSNTIEETRPDRRYIGGTVTISYIPYEGSRRISRTVKFGTDLELGNLQQIDPRWTARTIELESHTLPTDNPRFYIRCQKHRNPPYDYETC